MFSAPMKMYVLISPPIKDPIVTHRKALDFRKEDHQFIFLLSKQFIQIR